MVTRGDRKNAQVNDVRQTRVFQEGIEEGVEKVALRLIQLKYSTEEIVAATGLTAAQIRKLKKKSQS